MAVRIVLNPHGTQALKELTGKLKDHNPVLSRFQNNLVSQAVIDLNLRLNKARLKKLSDRLLSRQGKKKMLIENLKKAFDQGIDEAAVQSLENSVQKAFTKVVPISKSESPE